MTEACERRNLEFPLTMDAREVAKVLKREGWYAWASDYASIIFRIERVRGKSGDLRNVYRYLVQKFGALRVNGSHVCRGLISKPLSRYTS
jgi:hypothetical protein